MHIVSIRPFTNFICINFLFDFLDKHVTLRASRMQMADRSAKHVCLKKSKKCKNATTAAPSCCGSWRRRRGGDTLQTLHRSGLVVLDFDSGLKGWRIISIRIFSIQTNYRTHMAHTQNSPIGETSLPRIHPDEREVYADMIRWCYSRRLLDVPPVILERGQAESILQSAEGEWPPGFKEAGYHMRQHSLIFEATGAFLSGRYYLIEKLVRQAVPRSMRREFDNFVYRRWLEYDREVIPEVAGQGDECIVPGKGKKKKPGQRKG